ncbi:MULTISPECIES: LysR family transcriptional regulator [Alcaligenes]|jgi:DNA-binding transcriptional LysR family regulator|uniref:LysR family transcriptional regulator n=1 Tax=Alcaligenes faecalis TaxID=511 RepID=A0AB33CU25_ALCFA|nr:MULTISPECIES: LysR family transcriptional regulator [Alcaligenes]ASR88731.1 LysR family transcriptional regulator [Alcaligenes faecalis]QXR36836.1 LysR family transcriptional regulator [Alcaligenes aquatilis]HBQ89409.1 LysR family transcriptional regulator [Alcaligenes faecalis]
MLTSDHLELLLAVVEHGSFSSAARALRRTQSAVSMAVANLEAELDLTLFDRSRREPVPTAELLAMLPEAKLIASRLQGLRLHLQELSGGLESHLRLGIVCDVDPKPALIALQALEQRYPGLDIELRTAPQDTLVEALKKRELDLCIAYGGLELESVGIIQSLWTETISAVAAPDHPLVRGGPRPLEDLKAYRQIVITSPDNDLNKDRSMLSLRQWKTDNLSLTLELVERGLGWANLPLSCLRPSLESGRLHRIQFSTGSNGLDLPIYLLQSKGQNVGKAQALFRQALQDELNSRVLPTPAP